eukprot:796067-Pleurochrysis_carterae.AAC.1
MMMIRWLLLACIKGAWLSVGRSVARGCPSLCCVVQQRPPLLVHLLDAPRRTPSRALALAATALGALAQSLSATSPASIAFASEVAASAAQKGEARCKYLHIS